MQLEHLPRWVKASVDKFIESKRGSYHLYIDANQRDTKDKPDFFELRMDGPYVVQLSQSEYRIYIEISLEFTSTQDEKDFHKPQRMMGQALLMLAPCIPIMKYGDGSDDNSQTQLAELQRIDNLDSSSEINNFGQIDPNLPVIQGTVEAHYFAYLCDQ
jgi:hypothetical protein